jgi:hypothetical protein
MGDDSEAVRGERRGTQERLAPERVEPGVTITIFLLIRKVLSLIWQPELALPPSMPDSLF